MGMNRREFLNFMAVALGSSAVASGASAVAIRDDYYVNRKLGLGFIKPANWSFQAYQDFGFMKEHQVLSNFSPEDAEEIKALFEDPLVVISKYSFVKNPGRTTIVTPSILIHFEDYEGYDLSATMDERFQDIADGLECLFSNCVVEDQMVPITVSGCEGMHFHWEHLFEHENIEPLMMTCQTRILFTDLGLYTIHYQHLPDRNEDTSVEFEQFTDSLHIL